MDKRVEDGDEPDGNETYTFYFYQLGNSLYLIDNAEEPEDYIDLGLSVTYLPTGTQTFAYENFIYNFQIACGIITPAISRLSY